MVLECYNVVAPLTLAILVRTPLWTIGGFESLEVDRVCTGEHRPAPASRVMGIVAVRSCRESRQHRVVAQPSRVVSRLRHLVGVGEVAASCATANRRRSCFRVVGGIDPGLYPPQHGTRLGVSLGPSRRLTSNAGSFLDRVGHLVPHAERSTPELQQLPQTSHLYRAVRLCALGWAVRQPSAT